MILEYDTSLDIIGKHLINDGQVVVKHIVMKGVC
jgi:hypothetical protein